MSTELTLPTIIEVPQRLARWEPTLAALDRPDATAPAEQQPLATQPPQEADEPRRKQKDLF